VEEYEKIHEKNKHSGDAGSPHNLHRKGCFRKNLERQLGRRHRNPSSARNRGRLPHMAEKKPRISESQGQSGRL